MWSLISRFKTKFDWRTTAFASQDLSIIKDAGFLSQLSTIRARFGQASDNINKELKQLERELQEIHLKYQAKIKEIKKREFDAALDDLGPDGERLRDIIATAEGVRDRPKRRD